VNEVVSGDGGNAAGTDQNGGSAGAVSIIGGTGGNGTGSGANGAGGTVVLNAGAHGTGGTGGVDGEIWFQITGNTVWQISNDTTNTEGDFVPNTDVEVSIGSTANKVLAVHARDFLGAAEVWLRPTQYEQPSSNHATIDEQNNRPCLDFDSTTTEGAIWTFVMPDGYDGGQIEITLYWCMTSTTTNTVVWDIDFESVADGEDLSDEVWDTPQVTTGTITVPGTARLMSVDSVTAAVGSLDGAVAGDLMRIRVQRDTGTGTPSASDAELYMVHIKEVE